MKLTIIGASGHGKVVADIAEKNGYNEIDFLDDYKFAKPECIQSCGKWPIIGKTDNAENIDEDLFIAIGNSQTRKIFMERYADKHIVTLIHPNAIIASGVKIGRGTTIMAGVVINSGTKIGDGCIINTSSSIDYDCIIGDYSHIAVGTHLAGTVEVGKCTWIGAGATVIDNIKICDECMIGTGSVIVKDITEAGTYVGVPARKIK